MEKNKKNILIIDSDVMVGIALQSALENAGYTVTLSEDGSELFQKKKKIPLPHMVLIDIMEMRPEMDTFRFIRVLKSSTKTTDTKIIVCSESKTDEDLSAAKASGADGFLAKPVDPDQLVQRVDSLFFSATESKEPADSDQTDAAPPKSPKDSTQPKAVQPNSHAKSGQHGAEKKGKTWVDFRREVNIVGEDSRRHPRLEFHCPARIEGLEGVHNITDISLGGAFVELSDPSAFEVGQVRQLNIKFPTEKEATKVTAEVANVRKRGVGFKFVALTRKNQETIRFCFDTFKDTIPLL